MRDKQHRSPRVAAVAPERPSGVRHWIRRLASPYVLFVCLYCISALVLHRAFFPVGDTDLETDFFLEIVVSAQRLLDGDFSVANFPYKGPVYLFLLVPIRLVIGNWYDAAVFLNIVAGGACLILCERLVRRLWGRTLAIAVVVFLSVQRDFVTLLHRANSDMVFVALVLAAMLALLTSVRTKKRLAIAGALAAAAFLARYNGVFLPLASVPVLLFLPRGAGMRARLVSLVAYVVGFLAVTGPWFAKNLLETGMLLKTRNIENVVYAVYGQGYPRQFSSFSEIVTHDPGRFAAEFTRSLLEHAKGDAVELMGLPMAILAVIGVLTLFVRRPSREQLAMLWLSFVCFLVLGLVFYATRFSLLLVIPYAVLAFLPLQLLLGFARAGRLGRVLRGLVALVFVAVLAHQSWRAFAEERRIYKRRPLFVLPTSAFLARDAATSGKKVVAARKGLMAYYSGLQHITFPTRLGSLEDLLAFVKDRGVDYVVLSSIEFALMPDLRAICLMRDIPGLKEVYRIREARVLVPDSDATGELSMEQKLAVLEQNLHFARKIEQPVEIARNAVSLALLEAQSRGPRAAVARLHGVLAELQSVDSAEARHGTAMVHVSLGYFLASLGQPEKAFELIRSGLGTFEATGKEVERGMAYIALGQIHEIQRDSVPAAGQYRIAIEVLEKAGDSTGVAEARNGLARVEAAPK